MTQILLARFLKHIEWIKSVANFHVAVSLSIKARPGGRLFIKWLEFACEWNLIFIWKDASTKTRFEREA